MALPIDDTPVLDKDEMRKFHEQIEKDLKIPSKPVPTPKIEEARKAIRDYVPGKE